MRYTAIVPFLVVGGLSAEICPVVPVSGAQSFPICCNVLAAALNNLYTGIGVDCETPLS